MPSPFMLDVQPSLFDIDIGGAVFALLLIIPQQILGKDDPAGLARKQQCRPIPTVGLLVPTLALDESNSIRPS